MTLKPINKLLIGMAIVAALLIIAHYQYGCNAQADPSPASYMFTWQAPGDDGNGGGPAAGYELYISTDPELPYDQWTRVGGEPTPGEPFSVDSCRYDDLFTETTYFAYIVAFDDADPPNYSAISNIYEFSVDDNVAPGMVSTLGGHPL